MKKTVGLIVALLIFFPVFTFAQEDERALSGNIHGVFGQKKLDSDWEPTDERLSLCL